LKHVDSERYHRRLLNMKGNKWKNAISWRVAEKWFKVKCRKVETKSHRS